MRDSSWLAQAARIAGKDLRIEWRSREIVYTMGFFAVLVVLVFAFAFISGDRSDLGPGVTAGILWVALLFSGMVGLSRTFDRERESEVIRALLLSPVPRSAIYAGKVVATALLMLLVEAIVTPLTALFFSAPVGLHPLWLALLLFLGTVAFSAVGVVFSAALLRSRSRDVLLSVLLFPLLVPVLLAGANGTAQLLDTASDLKSAVFWTQFQAVMAIVFTVLGLWSFEPVVSGE